VNTLRIFLVVRTTQTKQHVFMKVSGRMCDAAHSTLTSQGVYHICRHKLWNPNRFPEPDVAWVTRYRDCLLPPYVYRIDVSIIVLWACLPDRPRLINHKLLILVRHSPVLFDQVSPMQSLSASFRSLSINSMSVVSYHVIRQLTNSILPTHTPL
jgi:hypothetical protein